MRLQDLLIGLLIFSLFMTIILGFAFSTYARMGVPLDAKTSQVLHTFEQSANTTSLDMFGNTIEMQNKSIGGSGVSTDTSRTYGDNVLNSGVNVLLIASRSFDLLWNVLNTISSGIGISPLIISTFSGNKFVVPIL